MSARLDQALQQAIAEGVLPAGATTPDTDARPWPVVLLTALGAWLAAAPLLIVVGLLMGDFVTDGVGTYLIGLLVLAGSVVVLRARDVPLFVEQLAVPGVLVGAGCLAFGLFRDLPERPAAAMLAAIALALVMALPRAWLQVLLGGSAAALIAFVLAPPRLFDSGGQADDVWLVLHGLLLAWVGATAWQRRAMENGGLARHAAALEAAGAGWLLVTLAGLAWFAGVSFLVGSMLGDKGVIDVARSATGDSGFEGLAAGRLAVSAGLAALGAALAARAWPALQRPALAGVSLVAVAMCLLFPTLGAVLLVIALTGLRHRFGLAAAAGVAAAWILGSFYYQLGWPLAHKAALLVGAAVVLGALAWSMARTGSALSAGAPVRLDRAAAWIALGTVATLAVAGGSIWQKERLIRDGQSVFVPLAPVDPRSLMQGDYMALNFNLPRSDWRGPVAGPSALRPWAVARRDARGVATVLRIAEPGSALADGEFPIELTLKHGDWILVTDAWYFKEGDAERWAQARFGEFRVAADGRALLVGMADAELRPLRP
jgi:uncharacterized membrane-anchored protein